MHVTLQKAKILSSSQFSLILFQSFANDVSKLWKIPRGHKKIHVNVFLNTSENFNITQGDLSNLLQYYIGGLPKKLQLLKQLVKLRKSSLVMILPDIRKCSKSDQNLVANRYSCFWSLGAIWQPLWLKNSHNVAIFSHFFTFSVKWVWRRCFGAKNQFLNSHIMDIFEPQGLPYGAETPKT